MSLAPPRTLRRTVLTCKCPRCCPARAFSWICEMKTRTISAVFAFLTHRHELGCGFSFACIRLRSTALLQNSPSLTECFAVPERSRWRIVARTKGG